MGPFSMSSRFMVGKHIRMVRYTVLGSNYTWEFCQSISICYLISSCSDQLSQRKRAKNPYSVVANLIKVQKDHSTRKSTGHPKKVWKVGLHTQGIWGVHSEARNEERWEESYQNCTEDFSGVLTVQITRLSSFIISYASKFTQENAAMYRKKRKFSIDPIRCSTSTRLGSPRFAPLLQTGCVTYIGLVQYYCEDFRYMGRTDPAHSSIR